MRAWYDGNNSCAHRGRANGRMERWRHAMASCMPCIKKWCTNSSPPLGASGCIGRLVSEKNKRTATERREIAAELAVHFERGRDTERAIQYLQQAGENAVRRSAYQEAISLLTKGLELLKTLPDTPERVQQELTLQTRPGRCR